MVVAPLGPGALGEAAREAAVPVRGQVQVLVGLDELSRGVPEDVEEIAVFPLGTPLAIKQTWNEEF